MTEYKPRPNARSAQGRREELCKRSRLRLIRVTRTDRYTMGLFECACGTLKELEISRVESGSPLSCGCLLLENNPGKHRESKWKDRPNSPEYSSWSSMRDRCNNTHRKHYKHYGGRGITICERWNSYEYFLEDMGRKPDRTYELERIDNNGNYCPENCRWATRTEQTRNTRATLFLEHNGRRLSMADWVEATGIGSGTIRRRIVLGWSIDDALTRPVQSQFRRKTDPTPTDAHQRLASTRRSTFIE